VSANPPKLVTLGRISGVFGVKGWIKIESYTDPRSNIVQLSPWTLTLRGARREAVVEHGAAHGNGVIAKLRDTDDRDDAYALIGAEIAVPRERLAPLPDGEYYWTDLEGLEVRTLDGVALGRVDHLLATGVHDVLVLDGKPARLIPFVPETVIRSVDLEAGIIVADWSPEY
jgi:16S rRNA processing protein RimM